MQDDQFLEGGPYSATFRVEVDGKEVGQFTQVSGLELTIDADEIKEGGQNGYVHKVPGRITWPNLILSRGVTQNDMLFSWVNQSGGESFASKGNKVGRSTVAVIMTNQQGKPLRTWDLEGAFPVRWKGPQFSSGGSDQLVEELEITHHGFRSTTH